jgi:hypothetical protein
MFKVGASVCLRCHNKRNPTNDNDKHFSFESYKAKDTHTHFPLKRRIKD